MLVSVRKVCSSTMEKILLFSSHGVFQLEIQLRILSCKTCTHPLGTMLNYCDRVVHDRKQKKDSSEGRSKIAK